MSEDNQNNNQQSKPAVRNWRTIQQQTVPRKMSEFITPEEVRRLLKEQTAGDTNSQDELPRSNT